MDLIMRFNRKMSTIFFLILWIDKKKQFIKHKKIISNNALQIMLGFILNMPINFNDITTVKVLYYITHEE